MENNRATFGMRVYIANFGRSNYLWPRCLERGVVATMIHEGSYPFYVARNRNGFIDWCIANRRTAKGITPTRAVASRWYGAMETVEATDGDTWIHKASDGFWWTTSESGSPDWILEPSQDPQQAGHNVYVCHKPCAPWSNRGQNGTRLVWGALHPKAQQFLFTEGTLQQLSDDNAEYAIALIHSQDLSPWHSRSDWTKAVDRSKRNPVTIYDARKKTIVQMAYTVKQTAKNANGQTVERTMKNKEMRFTDQALEEYIDALLDAQEGLCAITGISLQYVGEADDPEVICSLDRIDSDGHYEAGNLQIVCRFVNRWKNDSADSEFRRLIELVRA